MRSSGTPAVAATASACCQLHPTVARACLHRECFIEGEGGSKKRVARPNPVASARCLTHAHDHPHRLHVHPCATRHTTHARAAGGAVKGVSKDFKWMKDTRWNWNNWRDVIFRADGSFLAPAEGCEHEGNPQCQWSSDDEKVHSRPSPELEPESDPSCSPDPSPNLK